MAEVIEAAKVAVEEKKNGAAAVSFTAMKAQVVVPVAKAEEAVKFYKEAFGAEEVGRSTYRKRKGDEEAAPLLSAEIKIGSTAFLVCDRSDGSEIVHGISFRLETSNVDGAISKAVKAGAIQDTEVTEEEGIFGAGLFARLHDPFGTSWIITSAAAKKNCTDCAAA